MEKRHISYFLDGEKEYEKLLEFFEEKELILAFEPLPFFSFKRILGKVVYEATIFDISKPYYDVCGSYEYNFSSNLRKLDVNIGSRLEKVLEEFNP